MRTHRAAGRGFGLVETLFAVAIAATLVGLSLPGFRTLLDRVRVTTAAADFRAALAFARCAAIRRGQRVDLLPAAPAGWNSGWKVVVDLNNNQQVDVGEPVLRAGQPLPAGVLVDASLRDGTRNYLAFDPSGRPRSAHSASLPQFGSLMFRSGAERRKLTIGFLGRARLCDPDRERTAC